MKKITKLLGTKKNISTSQDKKNHPTSRDKKNILTSWDKKINQLLGTKLKGDQNHEGHQTSASYKGFTLTEILQNL